MPPDWILCLRHGEKPLDKRGKEEDGLSEAGCQRARLLADALVLNGSLLPDPKIQPSRIYMPRYVDKDGVDRTMEKRPYLTIDKLASRLGIEPSAEVTKEDVGALVNMVYHDTARLIVICWEHDCLVAWLQRFAGKVKVTPNQGTEDCWLPCTWERGRFDLLWRLSLAPKAGSTEYLFSELDQSLAVEEVCDHDGRPVGYVNPETGQFVARQSREVEQ